MRAGLIAVVLGLGLGLVLTLLPGPVVHAGATRVSAGPAGSSDERAALEVPEPSPLAVEFHQTGHWVWAFSEFWAMAVPAAILLSGASARLRDRAHRLARGNWYGTVTIYLALFVTLVFLFEWPVHYLLGFVRGHAYGLLTMTLAKWLGDSLKGLVVELVLVAMFAWVPFWLLGRFPRVWWLIVSALAVPYIAFMMLIAPVLIDPLFNDYGPMKDKALEQKILALARRSGIEGGRVFEVNKSIDTTTANAYVTGLLGTHRIVLWDTLLRNFDEREVLAVMAHEMGHYVLGHVERTVVLSSLVLVAGLLWVDRAGRWVVKRWGKRLGITSLADVAATPLLLLLLGVASTVLGPVALAYSRNQEHEADRFSLELTRYNHSAARAFADLQRENLGIPRPDAFCTFFRSSHPCIADRIEFCNRYRPWETGEPLQYGDRFGP
jgi:Zn-dependent protease with chaperone function